MRLPAQGRISQGFSSAHQAIDIAGGFDTPIVAPHTGRISAAGQMGSGTNDAGLAVDVDGGRFKSRMAHNNRILVKVGQQVSEGQQIATQGYTGYTRPDNVIQGTHSHWVLWDNGTRVDGRRYLTTNAQTQGGDMIPDDNNHYGRWRQLGWFIRGRELSRDEFRKSAVGLSWLKAMEILADSPEANAAQNAQTVGQLAVKDKWDQQIYSLQARIKQQDTFIANIDKQLRETQAQLSKLADQTELSNTQAKKIEELTKSNEELLADKTESMKVGNSFIQFIGNLFKGGK
jgi:septal ring factor EnvC (AmiA/AmiB activator)